MLTSRDIRILHLEPTDVCQAACPLCARETDKNFDSSAKHYISVADLEQLLPDEFVTRLHKMFMCGNYGDPAASHHTQEIYRWFRSRNPGIVLGMNTNGALQNSSWWGELASIMHNQQDYVVFSIDGLEDTNHVYRKNVNWTRLMANARAFIEAGGSAQWDMLVYRHNEHQVEQCEALARDMGFAWFRAKISKRPLVGALERPVHWIAPQRQMQNIVCHALQERSIYIDAQGRISPCCWLGSTQTNFVTNFDAVQRSWPTDKPNPICAEACGTANAVSNFRAQWQRETAL